MLLVTTCVRAEDNRRRKHLDGSFDMDQLPVSVCSAICAYLSPQHTVSLALTGKHLCALCRSILQQKQAARAAARSRAKEHWLLLRDIVRICRRVSLTTKQTVFASWIVHVADPVLY